MDHTLHEFAMQENNCLQFYFSVFFSGGMIALFQICEIDPGFEDAARNCFHYILGNLPTFQIVSGFFKTEFIMNG